jgi:hypothetical protein
MGDFEVAEPRFLRDENVTLEEREELKKVELELKKMKEELYGIKKERGEQREKQEQELAEWKRMKKEKEESGEDDEYLMMRRKEQGLEERQEEFDDEYSGSELSGADVRVSFSPGRKGRSRQSRKEEPREPPRVPNRPTATIPPETHDLPTEIRVIERINTPSPTRRHSSPLVSHNHHHHHYHHHAYTHG